MMKGIMRVPSAISAESMDAELETLGKGKCDAFSVIRDITAHIQGGDDEFPTDIDQDHFSTFLDWAMQIRETTGREWGECLEYAAILYFG